MIFNDFWNILWILVFAPLIMFAYFKRKNRGQIIFSSLKNLKQLKPSSSIKMRRLLIILRMIAISLLIIAIMRPQKGIEETKIKKQGIDIILCIDISGSMLAQDFVLNGKRRNRLDVVKNVVRDFINKRSNDRIGLVVFAGRAYTQCPLTLDYDVLLKFLDRLDIGMIEDGTAVGDGIATALARLKDMRAKSKVIILLTDGVNNAGMVDPANAAELAKALNIKIYTIGVGSKDRVPFPAQDFFGNKIYQWAVIDIDESSLQQIAKLTGAKYFLATDTNALKEIYDKINRLEKTELEAPLYSDYKELFIPFALLGLIILLVENGLTYTRFRILP